MSNELSAIIKGEVDLYEILELKEDATESQVKKSYRRKALLYHPDKNPSDEAARMFHLVSKTYEILTNVDLRSQYDNLRKQKKSQLLKDEELSAVQRKFKEELEKAEREFQSSTNKKNRSMTSEFMKRDMREKQIDKLREEGLFLRRKKEASHIPKKQSLASNTFTYESAFDLSSFAVDVEQEKIVSNTVKIRWKTKPGLKDLFNEDVLRGIMSIFGEVSNCRILPSLQGAKYDHGILTFKDNSAVSKAIKHDYRKSAKLWDGTNYRKLSSLLREVTLVGNEVTEKGDLALDKDWFTDKWYEDCKFHFKQFTSGDEFDITKVDLNTIGFANLSEHTDSRKFLLNMCNMLMAEESSRIKRRKIP